MAALSPRRCERPAAAARRRAAAAPAFGALLEQILGRCGRCRPQGRGGGDPAVAGQTSLQEVVEAVNAAELTLQTVVAVRDRMIAAYQEIMRMPI